MAYIRVTSGLRSIITHRKHLCNTISHTKRLSSYPTRNFSGVIIDKKLNQVSRKLENLDNNDITSVNKILERSFLRVDAYATVIHRLGENDFNFSKVISVWKWMRQNEIRRKPMHYAAIINVCSRAQKWRTILKIIQELKKDDVQCTQYLYNAIINAMGKTGHYKKALYYFREMLKEGVLPNIFTYNALIDGMAISDQWDNALMIFKRMKEEELHPDTFTFNALAIALEKKIQRFSMRGMRMEAKETFQDALAENVQPNTNTYTHLIMMFGQINQVEYVTKLFEEMFNKGLIPKITTYYAMIDTLSRARKWKLALKLLRIMQKKGLQEIRHEYVLESRKRTKQFTLIYSSLIRSLWKEKQLEKAFMMIWEMHQKGLQPTSNTYTDIVRMIKRDGELKKVLQILHNMDGLSRYENIFNSFLSEMGKIGEWEMGLDLFQFAQKKEIQLDSIMFIHMAENTKQMKNVVEIFWKMQHVGLHSNVISTNALFSALGKEYQFNKILFTCWQHSLIEIDIYTYNELIYALGKSGQWKKALKLYWKIQKKGIKLERNTYNTIIHILSRARCWNKLFELIREIQQEKRLAGNVTFKMFMFLINIIKKKDQQSKALEISHKIIHLMEKKSKWKEVLETIEQMQNLGLHTSTIRRKKQQNESLGVLRKDKGLTMIYNALINAVLNGDKCRKVFEIFQIMYQKRIYPDLISTNELISAMIKVGYWKIAFKVFLKVEEQGLYPNADTYHAIINAIANGNRWQNALEVCWEMEDRGIQIDRRVYDALVSTIGKLDQWQKTLQVFQKIQMKGINLNKVSYNTLIKVLGRAGKWRNTLNVYRKMQTEGIRPDNITTKLLISLLRIMEKRDQKEDALEFCQEIIRIMEHGCQWKEILTIIKEMLEIGLQSSAIRKRTQQQELFTIFEKNEGSTIICNAVINTIMKGNEWDKAMDIFQKMREKGLQLDIISYNKLIDFMGNAGHWKKVLELFCKMKEEGLQPNDNTYRALINAMTIGKQWEKALELSNIMLKEEAKENATPLASDVTPIK